MQPMNHMGCAFNLESNVNGSYQYEFLYYNKTLLKINMNAYIVIKNYLADIRKKLY